MKLKSVDPQQLVIFVNSSQEIMGKIDKMETQIDKQYVNLCKFMLKYQVSDDQCSVSEKALNPWANISKTSGNQAFSDTQS